MKNDGIASMIPNDGLLALLGHAGEDDGEVATIRAILREVEEVADVRRMVLEVTEIPVETGTTT